MSSQKSKITTLLFYTSTPLEYGSEADIATIKTAQAFSLKKNFRVCILTPQIKLSPLYPLSEESIRTMLGKAEYKKFGFFKNIKTLIDGKYILTRGDIHSLIPVCIAKLCSPTLRKRILIQCYVPVKYSEEKVYRRLRHILVYNTFLFRIFIKIISNRIQVFNTIDKHFLKGASYIKLPCEDIFFLSSKANTVIGNKKTVIISSKLSHVKGIDMLPQLFTYLTRKHVLDKFKFVIIGTGELQEVVTKLVKRYKNITVVSEIPHMQMPQSLAKGNIFLILSRYEGSSMSLAEAMAVGLVLVSFKVPGVYSLKTKNLIHFAKPFQIKDIGKQLILAGKLTRQQIQQESEQNTLFAKREYKMDQYIKKLEGVLFS